MTPTSPTVRIPGVRYHIRWMIRRDLDEVLAIESASDARPFTENELLSLLRERNVIGMVAEHGERVVGFMIYELHKDRLALRKLAVAPDVRRRGVGRQLVNKLVNKLNAHARQRIDLIVRDSHVAGHLFLRSMGFIATGVERGAFDDTGEDGYHFSYRLDVATVVTDGVCS